MTTTMTRKGFLGAALGGTVLLLLQACGGGGDDAPAGGGGGGGGLSSCSSQGAAISGNHGHSLSIPASDLDSTSDKTYSIQGGSDHAHTITLNPAQLGNLKAGQTVTVTSTTNFQHSHDVTITCA